MLTITNPTAAELVITLQVAFQHLSPNECDLRIGAIMQRHHSGELDLKGIFQATHENRLVGAMYSQCRPDGSVMLWVPAMIPGFPLEPIYESLAQYCRSQQAFAAVAMADRDQPFDERALCSVGQFRFLSDLIYLATEIAPNEQANVPYRLQFIPLSEYSGDIMEGIAEGTTERLARLVKATYEGSLDFPELMQIAPVEFVLQGYKAGALFRPELWFIIQKEGVDVGVLLLTDASPEQFELTYMGLLESVRRQGLSREIVRFAREITRREQRLLLLTSVDEKNVPACQAYLAQGFRAWDRKKVYARFYTEP